MTTDTAEQDPIDFEDYSDSASTFGDRLVLAREAMGLGQGQLARRMGVKVQTLRNWEEDRSEPRANRLQMLAGMLNVSPPTPGRGPREGGVAPLVDELRALRHDQLRLIERMARIEKRLVATLGAGADLDAEGS